MNVFYSASADENSNKVFMGAKLHEVGYVRFPTSRQRLKIKARKRFLPPGAATSHCGIFAGVPLPGVTTLPKIRREDKGQIFSGGATGGLSPQPKKWDWGGLPLFWRESKSQTFWEELLDMFDITQILDLSPGSGALARAAMATGKATYLGLVVDTRHFTWLQTIVDTSSLRFIAKQGPLYLADVAELITMHYKELVEEPTEEDAHKLTQEGEGYYTEDEVVS